MFFCVEGIEDFFNVEWECGDRGLREKEEEKELIVAFTRFPLRLIL